VLKGQVAGAGLRKDIIQAIKSTSDYSGREGIGINQIYQR
jgi:hypothetical protein